MTEAAADAIWAAVQEFIRALRRSDPTVRRWLVPQSDAGLLLDLYGEHALLMLLKDYRQSRRFVLQRIASVPREEPVVLVEIGWAAPGWAIPPARDRATLQLRAGRHRWQVEDIWPSSMDARLTVERARELAVSEGERADPALRFLAGYLELPLEGLGELDDVETLFTLGMDSRGFSPLEVIRAIRLWRSFRRGARPAYRKPALYAAAVEYAFCLLGLYGDTQRKVAAHYGVDPGGLSIRFNEIRRRLQLVYFDPRYAVLEEPADAPTEAWRDRGLPWPPPLRRATDPDALKQW